VRRDKLRASKAMSERVLSHPKIHLVWDNHVLEAQGNDLFLQKLVLQNNKTKDIQELEVSGLFYAIGHQPNTEFLKDQNGNYQITVDADGYIQVEPGSSKTSIEGVFACGDVQDKR
jgi:thioredoxin reductase (NADPH)